MATLGLLSQVLRAALDKDVVGLHQTVLDFILTLCLLRDEFWRLIIDVMALSSVCQLRLQVQRTLKQSRLAGDLGVGLHVLERSLTLLRLIGLAFCILPFCVPLLAALA
jgi:hypothetical protein